MTDNEIIKALEYILKNFDGRVVDFMAISSAIDLINRQQAEIERLHKAHRLNLLTQLDVAEKIKSEAIEEFAERLKSTANGRMYRKDVVYIVEIDNLAKEMVGDTE